MLGGALALCTLVIALALVLGLTIFPTLTLGTIVWTALGLALALTLASYAPRVPPAPALALARGASYIALAAASLMFISHLTGGTQCYLC